MEFTKEEKSLLAEVLAKVLDDLCYSKVYGVYTNYGEMRFRMTERQHLVLLMVRDMLTERISRRVLSKDEKGVLQRLIDSRCAALHKEYFSELRRITDEYEARVSADFKDPSFQYPADGTYPPERAYLSGSEKARAKYIGEMRQLDGICDVLGLRTNHILDCVLRGKRSLTNWKRSIASIVK